MNQINATRHRRPSAITPLLLLLFGASACTTLTEQQRHSLTDLQTQVQAVQDQLDQTQSSVADLLSYQDTESDEVVAQLQTIDARLTRLPKTLSKLCPAQPTDASQCPDGGMRVVVIDSGKMVVGELERVWLNPPGRDIVARIDTGASSSSVHAGKLVEFERDGDEWVRFEWQLKGESVVVERPVERYVRVVQQADPKGSRRPVVNMQVRVGDVEDSFDFTLADRAHLEYQIILGRNFLADVALVDVGQQFVQPTYVPAATATPLAKPAP